MTTGDSALLEELRDMWRLADPPPPGLTAAMTAAVVSAGLDDEWELLVLVRDSADGPAAQVRGLGTSRVLYFTAAEGWSLDAEIDGDQFRGQLLDFDAKLGSVQVSVESRSGESWTTGLDEVGYFALQVEATGSVRFTIRHGRSTLSSRWVEL